MSTIGVKYHNEDIHNIIPKPMSPTIKSPRYKSKKSKFLQNQEITKLKYNGHQTFGLARYEAPQFWNYLKKRKPRIEMPAVKFVERQKYKCVENCKNVPLPKFNKTNNLESTKKTPKNYVKANIEMITKIEPKIPRPRIVDTPRGTVKDLAHLIQMIKIRESENYGKIPKYLCKRRKQWEAEEMRKKKEADAVYEYRRRMGINTMGMGENVYMIAEETRQKLLDGLKENWNELTKQFLKLPVMSDTLPKMRRKMWLEKEMDQLEKDVKFVESHPFIYLERHDLRPCPEILAGERTKMRKRMM
ncbi:conserved hypothetical protein [Pediculus humanus corporis]|uniref:Enkurin domain-containing protein n=1 Tax=Pediculus humanus subsp. corporis TaxID=121224 RepID=E0VK49_PEDHC|nr:uncharacterized protein Phum_PHUM256930 [Pediculus humanus corporis]EEB13755.1 conserved hypothetical protein [Pediculus humanus corporis]